MAAGDIIISEIYANGSSSGIYNSDYVVLYNKTGNAVNLSEYSLQFSGGWTDSNWSSAPLAGSIQPNSYYLIKLASTAGGTSLPLAPDATGTYSVFTGAGRLALTTTQSTLSGVDPRASRSDITDFVGFSSTTQTIPAEGNSAALPPSQRVIVRKLNGTQDTNNNGSDFVQADPSPRNSTSQPFVCYVSGTLIRTACGDVAVEALRVGDLAVTASGEARPIRWIGHRTMACHGRKDAMPVRIQADAFGEGRPARDLYVSPAHAIAVDVLGEVLIPAIRLVNGTTVAQVEVESVTYWHVELDSHDILLAEGLPAESYLDCGNRRFFANAEATDLLAAPDARQEGPLPFCRPFHEGGPLVDLVRARLQDRAESIGWQRVEDTFAGLHLVADGRVIEPDVAGLTARFVLPADACKVQLMSKMSVPAHVVPGSSDNRRLGVALAALTIDDGLTSARAVALDDARLGEGFHSVECGTRWTNGSAVLPANLWDGCRGSFFLRVTLAAPALARWVAPGETAGVVKPADRRQA